MAKSSIEKALEKYTKENKKNMEKRMREEKRLAGKQQRDAKILEQKEARRQQAASIVNGQSIIGNMRILDKTAEELVGLLKDAFNGNEDYCIKSGDVELPQYLKMDLNLEFEKLKQYGLISTYIIYIDGVWLIHILPKLLTYENDKIKAITEEQQKMQNDKDMILNISGGQVNIARDNATINATQYKGITSDDLENIIKAIKENLRELNGEKAAEIEDILELVETEMSTSEPKKSRLRNCITLIAPMMTIANGFPVLLKNLQSLQDYLMQFISR